MSHDKHKPHRPKKQKTNYLWRILKQYFANSSIHGVGYLVEDNRHWSERLFWLTACILSWWGCGILISSTIRDFRTHKVDITLDTNYLNWEVEFPALHFCFYFSVAAKEYAAKITGTPQHKASTMIRLTKWISLGYDESLMKNISSEQFLTWREYIKPHCTDFFGQCLWNDEYIDCCQIFAPLDTNIGSCLSFNSIYTEPSKNLSLPKFVMNHRKQKAILTIYLNKTAFWNASREHFFLLLTSGIEYPSQSTGKDSYLTLQWSNPSPAIWDISLLPTYNDDGVVSMSYQERECRFTTETDGLRYLKSYSYLGCVMELQMQQSHSLCGCIGHLFPPSNLYHTCNSTELRCVSKNRSEIVDVNKDSCLPNCEEMKVLWFDNISPYEHDIPDWAVTKLMFNMLPGPNIRYIRYTAHSLLDVIVSTGGTLGLFSGASVLSLVELVYWLFLRRDDAE